MYDSSRKIENFSTQAADSTSASILSSIIPKSFALGGLTINVALNDTLIKNKSVIAEARYCEQMIRLDASAVPLQSLEQAFLHELTHWILFVMNEDELRNNEKLVDLFAHFLYQALLTSNYENAVLMNTHPNKEF